jgi:ABC-type transport system substrate-binding protein
VVPIYSFVTTGDKIWFSNDVTNRRYDPGRAHQWLAELGLKDTNGDGLLEDTQGRTVEFTLTTNASNNQRVETASFIAKSLRDVGLKANVEAVTLGVLGDKMQSNFDFDALVLGWQINPPPGPSGVKNTILCSGLNHVCFPSQHKKGFVTQFCDPIC